MRHLPTPVRWAATALAVAACAGLSGCMSVSDEGAKPAPGASGEARCGGRGRRRRWRPGRRRRVLERPAGPGRSGPGRRRQGVPGPERLAVRHREALGGRRTARGGPGRVRRAVAVAAGRWRPRRHGRRLGRRRERRRRGHRRQRGNGGSGGGAGGADGGGSTPTPEPSVPSPEPTPEPTSNPTPEPTPEPTSNPTDPPPSGTDTQMGAMRAADGPGAPPEPAASPQVGPV